MKQLIRIEEIMIFAISIYLFSMLGFSWWLFPLLLFVPDIFMIGYIRGTEIGAIIYNIGHHRGINLILYFIGILLGLKILALIGMMLFAHSTMDRVFGYGLKFMDAFKHTHLDHI